MSTLLFYATIWLGAVRDHILIQFQHWKKVNSVYREIKLLMPWGEEAWCKCSFGFCEFFLSMLKNPSFLEFCSMSGLHRIGSQRFQKWSYLLKYVDLKSTKLNYVVEPNRWGTLYMNEIFRATLPPRMLFTWPCQHFLENLGWPSQNRHWKLVHRSAICWNYLGLFRDYGLDHISR